MQNSERSRATMCACPLHSRSGHLITSLRPLALLHPARRTTIASSTPPPAPRHSPRQPHAPAPPARRTPNSQTKCTDRHGATRFRLSHLADASLHHIGANAPEALYGCASTVHSRVPWLYTPGEATCPRCRQHNTVSLLTIPVAERPGSFVQARSRRWR